MIGTHRSDQTEIPQFDVSGSSDIKEGWTEIAMNEFGIIVKKPKSSNETFQSPRQLGGSWIAQEPLG
jgi:hypothetical protein